MSVRTGGNAASCRSAAARSWASVSFSRRSTDDSLASCAAWAGVLLFTGYTFSGAIEIAVGRIHRIGITLLVAFGIALALALSLYLLERFVIGRRVPEMEPPPLRDDEE